MTRRERERCEKALDIIGGIELRLAALDLTVMRPVAKSAILAARDRIEDAQGELVCALGVVEP